MTEPAVANSLLAPATEAQHALLHLAATVAADTGAWPIFQYVEAKLDEQGLDATEVLASLPVVHGAQVQYSWVRRDRSGLNPDTSICLTVAGLGQLKEFAGTVDAFLRVVAELGARRLAASYDPHTVVDVEVRGPELIHALNLDDVPLIGLLPDLLRGEPATWHGAGHSDDAGWLHKPSAFIRRFRDARTLEDYLDRLNAWIASETARPEPALTSPLALVAAFDYLGVVWQLRFGGQLVHLPGAERTARLAFDAYTLEEFDNRLSALGEVIKGLAVPATPGVPANPLTRLQAFLPQHLTPEAMFRIDRAIAVLQAATHVRNGGQHVDASSRAAPALVALGLTFPLQDPTSGWWRIQVVVIEALDAIREEIRSAPSGVAG